MVRKGYHAKVRKQSPKFWTTKRASIVTIHDPRRRVNVKVQAVRFIGDQPYYYENDHGKIKDARDHQKYLRETGHNAQIKRINNRHVVFSRKRKK